jgi:hypothetical protein
MTSRAVQLTRFATTSVATLVVALLVSVVGVARAQDQTGEVLVVLASEQAGVIDSNLAHEPALRQPPFNSYRSMRLLERHPVTLAANRPIIVALPNGRNLQIVLVRMLPNGRLQVRVSINRPAKNDYLQGVTVETSAGVPFFIAGQAYQGGTLVIGVRVGLRGPQTGVRVGPIGPIGPIGPRPFGRPLMPPPPPIQVGPPPPVQVGPPPAGVRVMPPSGVRVVPPPHTGVRVTPPTTGVRVTPTPNSGTVQVAPGPSKEE